MSSRLIATDRICSLCGSRAAIVYASSPRPYWCAECRKNKGREYRAARSQASIDKTRKRQREWKKMHPRTTEENTLSCTKWRNGNRENARGHSRLYDRRHIFKQAARRLRRAFGVTVAPITLWGIWKKQRGICCLTGRSLDGRKALSASIDHIVSTAKGGRTEADNLRWVCLDANFAKRSMSDGEFLNLCKAVVKHMHATRSDQGST